MKNIYLIVFVLLTGLSNSQTLTQSFNEPVVGDVDKTYRLDTSAYTTGLPLALTGTNCVWDFTKLEGAFPVVVDSFIAPSAAPNASAYPGSTFVQHRDQLYTFYKSSASQQQTELLGGTSPSLTLTFTNSAIIATYPVSFGYNYTDPVSGTFKYNTINGAANGDINISVPGTGTANFPNNNAIQNVICLRSVEILTLSSGAFPFGTFKQTIYNFYMPGKKFPILNINYTNYSLFAGTPTITAYVYGSNNYFTVAGLNESLLSRNSYVYPNPFTGALFLKTKTVEENEYLFYNVSGSLLFSTRSLESPDILNLKAGNYIVQIRNKSGSYFQKLMKE